MLLFGEPLEYVDTTRYLRVYLDRRLTWSPYIDQVRKMTAQRMGMLGPLVNRKSYIQERSPAILGAHPPHDGICVPRVEVRCPLPCPVGTSVTIQVYSPRYWCPLVRKYQADT